METFFEVKKKNQSLMKIKKIKKKLLTKKKISNKGRKIK